MKRIILIVYFVIILNCVKSQINKVYTYEKDPLYIEYNLILENNNYYIEYSESLTEDILYSKILSFGYFEIKNNIVVFKDTINKYKMEMFIFGDLLLVKKSFNGLTGCKFKFSGNSTGSYDFVYKDYLKGVEIFNKAISTYNNINTKRYKIDLGTYENNGFKLNIESFNRYSVEYKYLLISKGFYFRNHNELLLFDCNLNHVFHALIGEGFFISKLLPGDYDELKLVKIKQ